MDFLKPDLDLDYPSQMEILRFSYVAFALSHQTSFL